MDEESEYLQCPRCCYATKTKVYFDDHVNGIHKYTKCPWCDLHFAIGTRRFALHLRENHGMWNESESCFECPHCQRKFVKTVIFTAHIADAHKIGPLWHCGECDYSAVSKLYLKTHKEQHNEATFLCNRCPHVAKSAFRLRKHIYSVHDNVKKDFVCEDCGAIFTTNGSLKTHKLTVHQGISRTVQLSRKMMTKLKYKFDEKCKDCEFEAENYHQLHYHRLKYHREKSLNCDQCDFKCSTKSMLNQHIEKKHLSTKYTCDDCGGKFSHKLTLRRHKNLKHSDSTPTFRCEMAGCEYEANSSHSVKRHTEKVHLGIRWPCDMCDFIGSYKGDTITHKRKVHRVVPEGAKRHCEA
eukprot:TRINITY_DN17163_c0_g2_i1.p1 TRINITY_DN17163_c0_g2~~TRINITY_DN17163_c0_g2_i1.p1  ORF type:complete len:402 (-),score=60.56 TRINITY_DN17163_c0_g2_i1:152-1210(-)